MAARITTFSLLLLVSLLSLSTTKSVAHNHPLIPSSCIGHPGLLQCALDFQSALKVAASAEINIAASALSTVALDAINAAKVSGTSILHFLSSIHGHSINDSAIVELISKWNTTIGIAVQDLVKASTIIHGKTKLSVAKLHNVEKSLNIASGIAAKFGASCKHSNIGTNALLGNLIKQFINLTNLSVKIIGTITANSKVSF